MRISYVPGDLAGDGGVSRRAAHTADTSLRLVVLRGRRFRNSLATATLFFLLLLVASVVLLLRSGCCWSPMSFTP